ncbi:uncharacterized protein LOC142332782 [Lycorma delicatula]|uniref:uncharacterized protein LOC142332782 n=1 Tax=Lycorma delicatula TaxID=130591 RepID=UPI003F511893
MVAVIGFCSMGTPVGTCGSGKGYVCTDLGDMVMFLYITHQMRESRVFELCLMNWEMRSRNSEVTQIILAGDFTAKSPHFVGTIHNLKWQYLGDKINALRLTCMNEDKPVICHGNSSSAIEFTFISEQHVSILCNWRILEESLSDHLIIAYEVTTEPRLVKRERVITLRSGYVRFSKVIRVKLADIVDPEELTAIVTAECDKMRVIVKVPEKRHAYWWGPELQLLRRRAWASKRVLQ